MQGTGSAAAEDLGLPVLLPADIRRRAPLPHTRTAATAPAPQALVTAVVRWCGGRSRLPRSATSPGTRGGGSGVADRRVARGGGFQGTGAQEGPAAGAHVPAPRVEPYRFSETDGPESFT